MIRRILAYCLFVLGFFTILFFRHYSGDLIPHPFLFWLLGILLFYLGYLLFRSSLTPKDNAARKKLLELINDLKINGEKEKFMSRVIPKDKLSLSVCLDEQKQTVLYVDKTDRERYYFDLDFLRV